MDYKELAEVYEALEHTSKRLEKTFILSEFLRMCPKSDLRSVAYLLQGRVFPVSDERSIGISSRSVLKAIAKATGDSAEKVEHEWKVKGDLGLVAELLIKGKKQQTLFSEKLTVQMVFDNIQKLAEMEGEGTVDKKVSTIAKLLTSASPLEAKYITRTVLEEMRAGIAMGTMRDALVWAFLPKVLGVFTECRHCKALNPKSETCLNCKTKLEPQDNSKLKILKVEKLSELKNLNKYDAVRAKDDAQAREVYDYFLDTVQNAYDMCTDVGEIAMDMKEDGLVGIKKAALKVGRPIKVMLYLKAKDIEEAFETVGVPAIGERKFDGFRLQVHGDKDKVTLFTRRLENVTNQFPDVVEYVRKHVKSNNFILDSEVLGMDPKTKRILPFQNISQRIKRKHDIAKLVKGLPVKLVIFDAMQVNGESLLDKPLEYRTKKLKSILKPKKDELEFVEQFITSNIKQMEKFYRQSLDEGHEGIMIKNVNGIYKPGARVGFGMKLKPVMETLDLVIVGAEWGEGKRSEWLSSFTLACRDGDQLLEVGKVGTGIKEKSEEGVSFSELTEALKPLVTSESGKSVRVKPRIIVEINYEEIQKSPTYSSGFALRFPRVVRLRTMEKGIGDISTIDDLKRLYRIQK